MAVHCLLSTRWRLCTNPRGGFDPSFNIQCRTSRQNIQHDRQQDLPLETKINGPTARPNTGAFITSVWQMQQPTHCQQPTTTTTAKQTATTTTTTEPGTAADAVVKPQALFSPRRRWQAARFDERTAAASTLKATTINHTTACRNDMNDTHISMNIANARLNWSNA